MNARAHIFVSGRVQGVFFRQKTKDKALTMGVYGWVQNLPDGRVEAVFEGDPVAIKKLILWCRTGPENAAVDGLEARWDETPEDIKGFSIRY